MWYTIKAKVVSFFADIRFYNFGLILWGDSHYNLKGPHVREILDSLEPGDVLLRKYDHYLGSRLISGFWSHAAVYIGDNQVVHMLGDGITQEDILTFTRCDHMAILRCRDIPLISIAIEKANQQMTRNLPKPGERRVAYDYDFESGDDKFYCTEFVSFCYGHPKFEKVGKFILPDDFLYSIFDKIWSY